MGSSGVDAHFLKNVFYRKRSFCIHTYQAGDSSGHSYLCRRGDVIEMILDLDKGTLTYKINGKHEATSYPGVANVSNYRAAVKMDCEDFTGCIQLLENN